MKKPSILYIALDNALRHGFDYTIPSHLDCSSLLPGCRVIVPIRKRLATGILIKVKSDSECPYDKLRPIHAILDHQPIIPKALFDLCLWAANYYQYALGEILFSAIPKAFRHGETPTLSKEKIFCANKDISVDTILAKRATRLRAAFTFIQSHPDGVSKSMLLANDISSSTLKTLSDKALITCHEKLSDLTTYPKEAPFALTQEQAHAFIHIKNNLHHFKPYLLYGITGSGKTEVYLQLIENVLAAGKQALVLVPEITLTPQTIARFKDRLTGNIVALHSGLNDNERCQHWLQAKENIAQVVIGTRSALFTPFHQLGIIIIDEEHDQSFKQHEGFRYHARDLAIKRASMLNIPIVLGSATPSCETYFNAKQKKFECLSLTERAGNAIPPTFHCIDCRNQTLQHGLSQKLIEKMRDCLQRDEQVIIFLNRRGYAPSVLCHDCGYVATCNRCDVRLTLHKSKHKVICHHCGYETREPVCCEKCNSKHLLSLGQGTQRIEEYLQNIFKDIDIIRIDRDSTRRKGSMQRHLENIHQGGAKILLGTQMLAKGHHFPNVTLVGIIDADHGLLSSDFRAPERIAQLLLQIAGRAGRADKTGAVYLQTHQPNNPILNILFKQDYLCFLDTTLAQRQAANMPPYATLALLSAQAPHTSYPMQFLNNVKATILKTLPDHIALLGPIPAALEKKAGLYRAQLLFHCSDRKILQRHLPKIISHIESIKLSSNVRWILDVDPQETI